MFKPIARRPVAVLALLSWVLFGVTPVSANPPAPVPAPLSFGITPVFLVDQANFLEGWKTYLSERLGRPVRFVRRKSYVEITDLLLNGDLDAAWICSFSYVFNRASLKALAVPLFRGEPYYESYLIVPASDGSTQGYAGLAGKVFAYVEPRSNTGYLYPRYAIKQLGRDPNRYFRDSFFTWSHADSVVAVADRLADAAAVDGYIWETLRLGNPSLTDRTRRVSVSRQFGFPPVVAGAFFEGEELAGFTRVLLGMDGDPEGRRLLGLLHLDRFITPAADLYEGIPAMLEATESVAE